MLKQQTHPQPMLRQQAQPQSDFDSRTAQMMSSTIEAMSDALAALDADDEVIEHFNSQLREVAPEIDDEISELTDKTERL